MLDFGNVTFQICGIIFEIYHFKDKNNLKTNKVPFTSFSRNGASIVYTFPLVLISIFVLPSWFSQEPMLGNLRSISFHENQIQLMSTTVNTLQNCDVPIKITTVKQKTMI